MAADISVRDGDLVEVADVEAIVNAWNRNVVPWWLLYRAGCPRPSAGTPEWAPSVSSPVTAGCPLARTVTTGAGRLPYRGIIHVARHRPVVAGQPGQHLDVHPINPGGGPRARGFGSLAFPVIGSGSGGVDPVLALEIMVGTTRESGADPKVVIVRQVGRGRHSVEGLTDPGRRRG